MKQKIQKLVDSVKKVLRAMFRPETVAAVVIVVTIVAVSVNTSRVILQNYKLERDVREAQQKADIAQIELETQKLKNLYFQTDAFFDIAARKQLSMGLPGEKLIIVPKSVALSKVPELENKKNTSEIEDKSKDLSHFEQWLKFLSGDLEYVPKD